MVLAVEENLCKGRQREGGAGCRVQGCLACLARAKAETNARTRDAFQQIEAEGPLFWFHGPPTPNTQHPTPKNSHPREFTFFTPLLFFLSKGHDVRISISFIGQKREHDDT